MKSKITVMNPYYEKTYTTAISLARLMNDIDNIERGNLDFLKFMDVATGNRVTLSPKNFASIEVEEVKDE